MAQACVRLLASIDIRPETVSKKSETDGCCSLPDITDRLWTPSTRAVIPFFRPLSGLGSALYGQNIAGE